MFERMSGTIPGVSDSRASSACHGRADSGCDAAVYERPRIRPTARVSDCAKHSREAKKHIACMCQCLFSMCLGFATWLFRHVYWNQVPGIVLAAAAKKDQGEREQMSPLPIQHTFVVFDTGMRVTRHTRCCRAMPRTVRYLPTRSYSGAPLPTTRSNVSLDTAYAGQSARRIGRGGAHASGLAISFVSYKSPWACAARHSTQGHGRFSGCLRTWHGWTFSRQDAVVEWTSISQSLCRAVGDDMRNALQVRPCPYGHEIHNHSDPACQMPAPTANGSGGVPTEQLHATGCRHRGWP